MLKNMKILQRLILAFVAAVLISSIAGILGFFLLEKIDSDYSAVLVNYGFSQGEIGNLGRHFQNQRANTMFVITSPDAKTRSAYIQDLNALDVSLDNDMVLVKKGLGSAKGEEVYAQLDSTLKSYRVSRDEVLSSLDTRTMAESILAYREKCGDSAKLVAKTLDTMLADKTSIGLEKSTGLTTQTVILRGIMFGVLFSAFLIALVLAVITARSVSKPVGLMEQAAAKLAAGNFDVEISYHSGNEIGGLADSMRSMISSTKSIINDTDRGLSEIANGNFNIEPNAKYIGFFKQIELSMRKITTKLSQTMFQIKTASDQVSAGSDQVAGGAQALSQGATEQASSIQELSATISEISSHVKENADNANNASSKVSSVSSEIVGSNDQMQALIEAMEEISSASSQIGKVIKTIEDIAFQTNILALNAAVEAARAGSAGKGFAVVADEVRNLASKSAQAAKGTTSLIEGSIRAVENGTRLADETAKSLQQVVAGAQSIEVIIDSIATASNNQANSIHQVTLGIDQISAVVQTNSATAEESAAASEELSGQAQLLKNLVSSFNLRETDSTALYSDIANTPDRLNDFSENDFVPTSKY